MDLFHAMRTAPALRDFRTDPVPDDAIHRVIDAARFAPSGGNLQPWKVVVVQDVARRQALADLYRMRWDAYQEKKRQSQASDEGVVAVEMTPQLQRRLDAANEFAQNLDSIPVHLIVCAEMNRLLMTDRELDRPTIVGGASVYPFVQNLLLGFRAEGLGAALTTLIVSDEPDVRDILRIPDGFAVAAYVLAAHTNRDLERARLTRNEVEQIAFRDEFGVPFSAGDQP